MTNSKPRSALRLSVVLPVLLVALAGCSTVDSGASAGPGSVSQTPTSGPDSSAGLQCDAVAKSFDDQAKSQGVNFTYTQVDPSTIIGVRDLPAGILSTGCFVSANQKVAYALMPASDSTAFTALAATLIASGYVQDDSENTDPKTEHSFYQSDKTVPSNEYQAGALEMLTVDQLKRQQLPVDLFDENDGPMLYIFAGMN